MSASGKASQDNVVWHNGHLERPERWEAIGHGGATLWLTGLPASGKSTIATALERELVTSGRPAYVLDGDNLRHGLCKDLGFDAASRTENVRRVAHVAAILADAGTVAIVSLVSPYEADRRDAREIHEQTGLPFAEVFMSTSLEECERRDPKGLYAKARAGEIPNFTGIGAPYEAPGAPDVTITPEDSVERSVWRLTQTLDALAPATGAFA